MTLTLTCDTSQHLIVKFSNIPAPYDRLWFRLVATKDEKVYGGGEQFSFLNLKGMNFPIWTREQGK